MIILNYLLPPYNFYQWHEYIKDNDYIIENPPLELHLTIDTNLLTKDDKKWIKIHCSHIPELNKIKKK